MLRRLLSWSDHLGPHRRTIVFLAGVFATLFAASLALEHGNLTRIEVFQGPFNSSSSSSDKTQYVVPIGTDIPFLSIPSPVPQQDRASGEPSRIRLWVNNEVF